MLSEHDDIEVIAVARNGVDAIKKVAKYQPDVLILDLIMPEMDGLTAFKKIMIRNPTPTLIFSGLNPQTQPSSVQALLMGAFDYIMKPKGEWKVELPKYKDELITKVLQAATSQIKSVHQMDRSILQKAKLPIPQPIKFTETLKPLNIPPLLPINDVDLETNLIVIGASTGGPKTLKTVLHRISKNFPSPILVVQHMQDFFMDQFARTLDSLCILPIHIAKDEELIIPGKIYIAPGNRHMEITVQDRKPCIKVSNGEPVNFCRPSIDVLFFSAVRVYKNNLMGILLTGIGKDGVRGLGAIRQAGGKTISESKETAIVYGIPKYASLYCVTDEILPNYEIPDRIRFFAKRIKSK